MTIMVNGNTSMTNIVSKKLLSLIRLHGNTLNTNIVHGNTIKTCMVHERTHKTNMVHGNNLFTRTAYSNHEIFCFIYFQNVIHIKAYNYVSLTATACSVTLTHLRQRPCIMFASAQEILLIHKTLCAILAACGMFSLMVTTPKCLISALTGISDEKKNMSWVIGRHFLGS